MGALGTVPGAFWGLWKTRYASANSGSGLKVGV